MFIFSLAFLRQVVDVVYKLIIVMDGRKRLGGAQYRKNGEGMIRKFNEMMNKTFFFF